MLTRATIAVALLSFAARAGEQPQFLRERVDTVKAVPGGLGLGVIWWYPESVRTKGVDVWKGGDVALFDADGSALPALDAFAGKPKKETGK